MENEQKSKSEVIGCLLGDFFGALVVIGATAVGVWQSWNLVFADIAQVDEMKYYQALMLIVGWRCLTFKTNK